MSNKLGWAAAGIGSLIIAGLFWWYVVRIPPVSEFDKRTGLLKAALNLQVYRLVDDDEHHSEAPFDAQYTDRRQLPGVAPSESWRNQFLALLADKRANNGTPTCGSDPYGEFRLDFSTSKGKVSLYVHFAGDEFLWLDRTQEYPVRWLNFSPARPQYVRLIKELFPAGKEAQELDPLDRHDRDVVPY